MRVIGRLVLCTIAVASVLTACADEQPTNADMIAYAESAPPMGEAVRFFIYTHCGVESLRVDGRWWRAVETLPGGGEPGEPPDGWGDPYQEGELTLNSKDSITFETKGEEVDFVPSEDEPTKMCR